VLVPVPEFELDNVDTLSIVGAADVDASVEAGDALEEATSTAEPAARVRADDDFSQYGMAVTQKGGRKGPKEPEGVAAKEPKVTKREKRAAKSKLTILFETAPPPGTPDAWAVDSEPTAIRHPNDKWDKEHYRAVLAWVRSHVRQAPDSFMCLEELVTRCLAHPDLPAARELAPEKRLHKALRKVFRGLPKGVAAHSLFANLRVGAEEAPNPPVSQWGPAPGTERHEASERPEGPEATTADLAVPAPTFAATLNGTASTGNGASARMASLSLAPNPPVRRATSSSPPPAKPSPLHPSPSMPLFGMGSGMWGGVGGLGGLGAGLGGLGLGGLGAVASMWEEVPEPPTPLLSAPLKEASSMGYECTIKYRLQTQQQE
jgi:hypothetical protein